MSGRFLENNSILIYHNCLKLSNSSEFIYFNNQDLSSLSTQSSCHFDKSFIILIDCINANVVGKIVEFTYHILRTFLHLFGKIPNEIIFCFGWISLESVYRPTPLYYLAFVITHNLWIAPFSTIVFTPLFYLISICGICTPKYFSSVEEK